MLGPTQRCRHGCSEWQPQWAQSGARQTSCLILQLGEERSVFSSSNNHQNSDVTLQTVIPSGSLLLSRATV